LARYQNIDVKCVSARNLLKLAAAHSIIFIIIILCSRQAKYNRLLNASLMINSFTNIHLNLIGTVPKQVSHFSSLNIFCLGCETISRRAKSDLNKIYKVNWNGNLVRFCGALKCCSSVIGLREFSSKKLNSCYFTLNFFLQAGSRKQPGHY